MLAKKTKLIFSIISVFLMIPTIYYFNQDAANYDSFYRTYFVFFIDEVIEMFADDEASNCFFIDFMELLIQWLGAIACALAFCMLMPGDYFKAIQVVLLGVVFANIFCAALKTSILTWNRKQAKKNINQQAKYFIK